MSIYDKKDKPRKNNAVYSDASTPPRKISEIKFSKKFLEAIYKKLTGLAGRTPIHLMAVPGRLKNRLDLCDLSIANVEPDLDLFSGKVKPQTDGYSKKFLEILLTKDKFDFRFSWEDKKITSLDNDIKSALTIVGKRLDSMAIENEDVFIDTGLKNFGFGYPLLVLPDPKDKDKATIAPIFIWSLDIRKSNRKNEWIISKTEDSPIKMNEILISYIENTTNVHPTRLEAEDLDDGILQADEIQKYLKDLLQKLNIAYDNLDLKLEPTGKKENLIKLCPANGFIHWSGVFGLYRSQKETIIESVLELERNIEEFNAEDLELVPFSTASEASFEVDPSQSEIIRTLNNNEFKIIQGPPGTGKSQAISAIISNALANGAKTLVVCEKKTALDVLKRNLEEKGLDTFCVVIDDVNKDRKNVVNKARSLQEYNPTKAFNAIEFERDRQEFLLLRDAINKCYNNASEKIFGDYTWTNLIGLYLKHSKSPAFNDIRDAMEDIANSKFKFNMDEFVDFRTLVKTGHERYAMCKHIDTKAFNLLNLTDLADVSISDNFKIQDNVTGIRKKIKDATAFFKDNDCSLGKVSVTTDGKKLEECLQSIEPCVKAIEDIIQISKSKLDYKSQGELFNRLSAFNKLAEKGAATIGLEANTLEEPIFDAQKYIQSTEKLDNTVTEYSATIQQMQSLETAIQTDSGAIKELVDIAGALCKSMQTTAKKFESKHNIIDLDASMPDKMDKLSFIESSIESINTNFGRGNKIIGNDFASYKGSLISRLFSKKSAEAAQYAKNIRVAYNDIENTLAQYAKSYRALKAQTISDEAEAELSDIVDVANKISAVVDAEKEAIYSQASNLLPGITQNHSALASVLADRNRSMLDMIGKVSAELSKRLEIYASNTKTLQTIQRGKAIIAETNLAITTKFVGVKTSELAYKTKDEYIEKLDVIQERLNTLEDQLEDLEQYISWLEIFTPNEKLFSILMIEKDDALWDELFVGAYYYYFLVNHEKTNKKRFLTTSKENHLQTLRDLFLKLQNNNTKKIFKLWSERREEAIENLDDEFGFKALFALKRGKHARKLSLRQIIERDFDSFTDLFPVIMVNPIVANALLPLKQGLFNLVIFDEASQLRIEDVYTSMIRGQYKIIAGDKHQMPPSSWFAKNADNNTLDEDDETDELELAATDAESLLEYAEHFKNAKQFASHLDFHYRSKHPALIEFSNCAFYGCNLCPLPNRLQASTPFEYHQVGGIYTDRTNKEEAFKVVELMRNLQRDSKGRLPSVGIATFNIQQRNLIKLMLHEVAAEDQAFSDIYTELQQHKDPLFVKNLENIQGDERDVIIISTTYGPGADKKFREQFVINRQEGYRLLNVLITRAKQHLAVVTSIPENKFLDYSNRLEEAQENNKIGIFYAYLTYVRAHATGDFEASCAVLKDVSKYSYEEPRRESEENSDGLTESPFEEEVYEELLQFLPKESILPQYKVGGYRLDFLIKLGANKIALECDGKAYHQSDEAFIEDMQRQKILEGYGYIFYRIWSTSWFTNKDKEVLKLKRFLEQYSQQ